MLFSDFCKRSDTGLGDYFRRELMPRWFVYYPAAVHRLVRDVCNTSRFWT